MAKIFASRCCVASWHQANDNFSKYSGINHKIFASVSFPLGVHQHKRLNIHDWNILRAKNTKRLPRNCPRVILWGHFYFKITSTYKYLFIQSHYQPISIHPTNISIFPLRAVKLKHLGQGSCQGPLHGKLQNKRSLKIFLTWYQWE